MIEQELRERMHKLLGDALPLLCKSGLARSDFRLDAIVGITFGAGDCLLVNIKDAIQGSCKENTNVKTRSFNAEKAGAKSASQAGNKSDSSVASIEATSRKRNLSRVSSDASSTLDLTDVSDFEDAVPIKRDRPDGSNSELRNQRRSSQNSGVKVTPQRASLQQTTPISIANSKLARQSSAENTPIKTHKCKMFNCSAAFRSQSLLNDHVAGFHQHLQNSAPSSTFKPPAKIPRSPRAEQDSLTTEPFSLNLNSTPVSGRSQANTQQPATHVMKTEKEERSDQHQYLNKHQFKTLSDAFKLNAYPDKAKRIELANSLNLSEMRIISWFANRRRKLKQDGRPSPCQGQMVNNATVNKNATSSSTSTELNQGSIVAKTLKNNPVPTAQHSIANQAGSKWPPKSKFSQEQKDILVEEMKKNLPLSVERKADIATRLGMTGSQVVAYFANHKKKYTADENKVFRKSRIFTTEQTMELIAIFETNPKPSLEQRKSLASRFGKEIIKINMWFSNRRQAHGSPQVNTQSNTATQLNTQTNSVPRSLSVLNNQSHPPTHAPKVLPINWLGILLTEFNTNPHPLRERRIELANQLNLTELKITEWFKTRRMKFRKMGEPLPKPMQVGLLTSSVKPSIAEVQIKRFTFTKEQQEALEKEFASNRHPSVPRRVELATKLNIPQIKKITLWFENQRKRFPENESAKTNATPNQERAGDMHNNSFEVQNVAIDANNHVKVSWQASTSNNTSNLHSSQRQYMPSSQNDSVIESYYTTAAKRNQNQTKTLSKPKNEQTSSQSNDYKALPNHNQTNSAYHNFRTSTNADHFAHQAQNMHHDNLSYQDTNVTTNHTNHATLSSLYSNSNAMGYQAQLQGYHAPVSQNPLVSMSYQGSYPPNHNYGPHHVDGGDTSFQNQPQNPHVWMGQGASNSYPTSDPNYQQPIASGSQGYVQGQPEEDVKPDLSQFIVGNLGDQGKDEFDLIDLTSPKPAEEECVL